MSRIARILKICLLLFTIGASDSWAAETEIFLKSGYFTWNETVEGADFVKERGVVNALGISVNDTYAERFPLRGLIEMWGGLLDYDGHDPTGANRQTGDSIVFGTREELTGGLSIGPSDRLALTPFGGIGHKFWIMSKTSEDWNMFYGIAGASAKLFRNGIIRGGMTFPFYTRNHASLERAGFADVVIRPDGRPSIFAEAGMTFPSWSITIGYEEIKFNESERVVTRTLQSSAESGIAVINYQAFQPATSWKYLSLKLSYVF